MMPPALVGMKVQFLAPSLLRWIPGQPKLAQTRSGSDRETAIEVQYMAVNPWFLIAQDPPPSVVFCTP